MTSKEQCKRIVDQCKQRLKVATDPAERNRIAIVGLEFNKALLELSDKKVVEAIIKKRWGL